MPTSLFYYIKGHCFKFATSKKKLRQTCPSNILVLMSAGEKTTKSLVEKNQN
jgi:hypothetical protein